MSEVEERIVKLLTRIRPYLNAEGGDVEYVGFEEGVVYVRMLGACLNCAGLSATTEGIEEILVENVPEVIAVRNVSDQPQIEE